ncbi:MAG: hypothetical protein JXA41_14070 [Deltaproteobacteria bacterium]|nr:hypothetical protein [Deltaproteobacteria bacterium]
MRVKILLGQLFGVLFSACLVLVLFAYPCCANEADKVPEDYEDLYRKLEMVMEGELSGLKMPETRRVERMPLISADLLVANANRGPALLSPDTIPTLRLSLDRFKEIGIQSVKFALHYPLLRPDFPHASDYLSFYKQVVEEAHARGIKVMPHVTVLFADTPFSPFKDIYGGINLERFKREYRDMIHLIVRELQPDFLTLLTEPDTHAKLTGLHELNDPRTMVDVVRYTLQGLDRGKTLIGAGSGRGVRRPLPKGFPNRPASILSASISIRLQVRLYPMLKKWQGLQEQTERRFLSTKRGFTKSCGRDRWIISLRLRTSSDWTAIHSGSLLT